MRGGLSGAWNSQGHFVPSRLFLRAPAGARPQIYVCCAVCVCACTRGCVWDRHSCCRGLYKCKEAVSVCFIRRTTDESQVEKSTAVCVCVFVCACALTCAPKEETKNGESRGRAEACIMLKQPSTPPLCPAPSPHRLNAGLVSNHVEREGSFKGSLSTTARMRFIYPYVEATRPV